MRCGLEQPRQPSGEPWLPWVEWFYQIWGRHQCWALPQSLQILQTPSCRSLDQVWLTWLLLLVTLFINFLIVFAVAWSYRQALLTRYTRYSPSVNLREAPEKLHNIHWRADHDHSVSAAKGQSVQLMDLKAAFTAAIPEAEARQVILVILYKVGGTRRIKQFLQQAMEIADDPIPMFRRALSSLWILHMSRILCLCPIINDIYQSSVCHSGMYVNLDILYSISVSHTGCASPWFWACIWTGKIWKHLGV